MILATAQQLAAALRLTPAQRKRIARWWAERQRQRSRDRLPTNKRSNP